MHTHRSTLFDERFGAGDQCIGNIMRALYAMDRVEICLSLASMSLYSLY